MAHAQFPSSLESLASPARVRCVRFVRASCSRTTIRGNTARRGATRRWPIGRRAVLHRFAADVGNEWRRRARRIDGFVVSWQGLEAQGGFNDRRMRVVLEAARNTTLRVCAYTETYVANPTFDQNKPPDPQTVFEWLVDVVDLYGSHPAYLRVGGRPVIFVYLAPILSETAWAAIVARLRATGRNPLLIGDFTRSTLLEPFDGEYQYTNVFSTESALLDLNRTESLRVRTYSLLRQGERRRIWVASVTRFDDSRLIARCPPRRRPANGGSTTACKSAIETAPTGSW